MLKNPFSPRLLKKVQMQGGAPGTHPQDGSPQMGLFQQPARARADDRDAVSRGFRGGQHGAWWLLDTPVKEEKNFIFS